MKKSLLVIMLCVIGLGVYAQKGEKAIGVNLGYGTEISNLGIGAKFQYGITDAIRAEASFDYFLKKDGVSMWDINLNAHYLFPVADKFKVYPLVGLTYTNWKLGGDMDSDLGDNDFDYGYGEEIDIEDSNTGKFGVNLGAGVEYAISSNLSVNFELKYQLISDFNQAVFGVGVAYKF